LLFSNGKNRYSDNGTWFLYIDINIALIAGAQTAYYIKNTK